MPPFGWIHGEPLLLHFSAQQLPVRALLVGAARVIRIRSRGHLVVPAGHLDFAAGLKIVQSQIHRATTIVTRSLGRVGDKFMLVRRGSVPEYFGDIPGPIGIENQQTVALLHQFAMGAQQSVRRGALQEGARG